MGPTLPLRNASTRWEENSRLYIVTSVFVIDCVIAAFGIIEIVYLLKHYCLDNDFGNDIEFCYIYLLEKRSETIRQILKRIRKTIMKDEHFPMLNLNSDFKPYR